MSGSTINEHDLKTKVRLSHLAVQSFKTRDQRPPYLGHVCPVRTKPRREKYPGQSSAYRAGANDASR